MDSNKLKGIRVSKGYTQEEISIKLGMAIRTYNRKELGAVEFNRIEILRIAEILELTIESVNEIFFENKLTDRLIGENHPA